jgi:hypothetical protein
MGAKVQRFMVYVQRLWKEKVLGHLRRGGLSQGPSAGLARGTKLDQTEPAVFGL